VLAIRSGDEAVRSRDVSAVILRILALILIVGGGLGALLGYAVARRLDQRRQREDLRRETEWLAHEDPKRPP
jgi:membrane protein YqaA with SNARE-associated domain